MLGAVMSSVKLIGVTQPVMVNSSMNDAQGLIAYCARVSNPANQENSETDKLLSYMIRNQHWSPFEMVNVVMEIETTRDIARQILRHRSFSFQELSQRYAAVQSMFGPREFRLQDPKNRQNSIEVEGDEKFANKAVWEAMQRNVMKEVAAVYDWAIENGVAKEVARSVLPEGLTMSRMYMNGTLRSWMHYVELRCGNGTQKEHREIAEECKKILVQEFPFLKTTRFGTTPA
jgi:thymidylate synthase (FAD)